jgi:hypothetical protein
MRETSYLCSVLDDCAALGDAAHLGLLATRWNERARRLGGRYGSGSSIAHAWWLSSIAANERMRAVRGRLEGNITYASLCERASESALSSLARLAKREARVTRVVWQGEGVTLCATQSLDRAPAARKSASRGGRCRECKGPLVDVSHHRAMGGLCGDCAFDEYDC